MRRNLFFLVAIGFLFGRVTFGATELITNGGFESGTAGWQFSPPLTTVPVVINPLQAHSGNDFLELGNAGGVVTLAVSETVVVPTNTILAQFSYFWGSSVGNDPLGADQFAAAVVNGQG